MFFSLILELPASIIAGQGPLFVKTMSNQQGDDAEYMADDYEMEDVDDDMDEEFVGREMGGSDSDLDEYDHMVC